MGRRRRKDTQQAREQRQEDHTGHGCEGEVTAGGVLDLGNLCCFFVLAQKKWDAATLSHV